MNRPGGRAAPQLRLTVSQFAERLRRWMGRQSLLQWIAIDGEVSDWNPRANGNVYFSLKDDRAVLRCVAFASEARTLPRIANGMAVVANGTAGIWERRSEYQLRVFEIEPTGIGAIAAKVEALRKQLHDEGLFAQLRKRPVPRFPRRVALVSARGQGADDFASTLREKAPNVVVEFIETRVQGDGAEVDIAGALDRASQTGADALVLLRGGGSYADRYPFNTEAVVRAIVCSHIPVVTAIGHTGDTHLADEVADAVFKTPTAAAEYIASSWASATERIARAQAQLARGIDALITRAWQRSDTAGQMLSHAVRQRISVARQRLLELSGRIERQNPRVRLAHRGERLALANQRLAATWQRLCSQYANRLQLARTRLTSADPQRPLERGYAIVTLNGSVLRDARDAAPGDEIVAQLGVGSLAARVERVNGHE
jgi:exodeoxyribonuclease VII large subunit